MGVITGLTAARMLAIEAASVIDGVITGDNLILEKFDGSTINAGNVRGPAGTNGTNGAAGPPGPAGTAVATRVSALPTTGLTDGQIAYYQSSAMEAAGIVWVFVYRAGGGTYKWEFVGGMSLINHTAAEQQKALGATYGDLTTVGPTVAVPLPGEYDIEFGARMYNASNTGHAFMCPDGPGFAANDTDGLEVYTFTAGAGIIPHSVRTIRKTATSAGNIVAKYRASVGNGVFLKRVLKVTPVRVSAA